MILPANPFAQYEASKKDIDKAITRVISSGRYVLGAEVQSFEKEFASYSESKYSIGVGSGTEALHIALEACNIGLGDEVITVSHTAVATASAITLCGATPRFVDIEYDSFSIDACKIEALINKKTKAIIPVHIYGNPVDMGAVLKIAKKHKLIVIEDCAQAHGAHYKGRRVGSMGDLGCFSFYPTKNLGALGDGGAIVCSKKYLAKKCQLLREYGWEQRYVSKFNGWNSRLDEIQAAVLRVKLKKLDKDNQKRREIAKIYNKYLDTKNSDLVLPSERLSSNHVYHLFVIKTSMRNELKNYLEENGVITSIQYPFPVHLQDFYKNESLHKNLNITEIIAGKILSLPIYPELKKSEAKKVASLVNSFYIQLGKNYDK
jgi:dTDP-4-amino-4,6-dideoxygalactose transaminase